MTDAQYNRLIDVTVIVGMINLAVTTVNSVIVQIMIRRKGK